MGKIKTFTERAGTFKFKLKYDKNKDRWSLIAFRENPKQKGKKRSSLVIIARTNAKLYKDMVDGAYWDVVYHESEDSAVAYATPLQRSELENKIVTKKGSVGYELRVKGTEGKNGLIFMKVFPNSRNYNKVTEEVLLKKIADPRFSLEKAYKEDILLGYQDTLQQVAYAENDAKAILQDTISYIKDMDSEIAGRNTKTLPKETVFNRIRAEIHPFMDVLPDPEELAGEVMDDLKIVEYSARTGEYRALV